MRARGIAIAVGAAAAALVVILATRDPAVSKVSRSPLVGRPAPVVDAVALDGEPFRLDDLRGRWVLVNFFATYCVPCRVEHPELVKFSQRHLAAGDARVVSVVWDDDPDAVRSFFDEQGGSWPVIPDLDGRVALGFGVAGVPESYLVSPQGFVASKIIGGVDADELDGIIDRLSGGAR